MIKSIVIAVALLGISAVAAETPTNTLAQVDRNDPNFVTASLLVASPGKELFTCAGHACLRMECPTFKLDSCYSYESESVYCKLLSFFAGRLKMGMFAFKTADYLEQYRKDGRGVRQYRLNLSPAAKVRLWKLLDDKVAQGADLPYDYEKRGCAQAMFRVLQEALVPDHLEVIRWPDRYKRSLRKVFCMAMADYPWTLLQLQAIGGTDIDRERTNYEKVVVPSDLLEILRLSRLSGNPVLADEKGIELQRVANAETKAFVTPVHVAGLLLLLAGINIFLRLRMIDWLFLGIQSLLGIFLTYTVFCTNLPATDWNWLVIPFNPLPLVFWRWRRWWIPAYVVISAIWCACMTFSSEMLTDPAYVVLALATALNYVAIWVVNMRDTRRIVVNKCGKIRVNSLSTAC